MSPLLVLATLLGAPPGAGPLPVDPPRYYFTLFAGQSVPFRPRTAHTWATWTKVTPTAGGLLVEPVTISWLPESGPVHPFWPHSVPGKNWNLEETLAIMAAKNSQVSRWGPYEVSAERYEAARRQAAFLGSGAARYRAVDSFNTDKRVVNCVHAVTHASPVLAKRIQPVLRVGEPGTSRLAVLYLRARAFTGYPQRHDWVIEVSGATGYAITAREPGEWVPRRFR